MKKILITGADSYVGTSFKCWLKESGGQYHVDTVDTKSESWRKKDFHGYDVIFHVAGIAHADTGEISTAAKRRYFKVNSDLPYEVAQKAKKAKVSQFIFMSSINIYGEIIEVKKHTITKDTVPKPSNFYGGSKWEAEKKLSALAEDSFRLVILRAPMIYGYGCKGNYSILSKIARKSPVFPNINNSRSMLYIDNLCEFVRLLVDNEESGIFFPQNKEYVKTSEMVRLIAKMYNKRIILIPGLNWLIRLLSRIKIPRRVGRIMIKAFGSLEYDMEMSKYKVNYHVRNLEESIQHTERDSEWKKKERSTIVAEKVS